MDKRKIKFSISASSRPLRIDIDPEFDIFRRLDKAETPPAISRVLGAKEIADNTPHLQLLIRSFRHIKNLQDIEQFK